MTQRAASFSAEEKIDEFKISSLLTRAAEILDSDSIFRQYLAANINAFYLALQTDQVNRSLQSKIQSLESRLAAIEQKINK